MRGVTLLATGASLGARFGERTGSYRLNTNLHDDLPVLRLVDVAQHVLDEEREVHLVHGHVGQGRLLEDTTPRTAPLATDGFHFLIDNQFLENLRERRRLRDRSLYTSTSGADRLTTDKLDLSVFSSYRHCVNVFRGQGPC